MNAKTCKHLRKMAHKMCLQPDNTVLPTRRLMVLPAHEKRFKFQKSVQGITAVNDPRTWRGIYRWLKRNYQYA